MSPPKREKAAKGRKARERHAVPAEAEAFTPAEPPGEAPSEAQGATQGEAPVPVAFAAPSDQLERMRARWQLGDWELLADIDEAALAGHPDRARLSLLAAAGCFQEGDDARGRRLARAALDWGCDRGLIARVLIGGVRNSLGRAAALAGDEDRAARLFEAAVAIVDHRGDAAALGRARDVHETARLGLLPEAVRMVRADADALKATAFPGRAEARRLEVKLEIVQSVLSRVVKRGQLAPGHTSGHASGGGSTAERRSASQLGQDLWVLERTGQKRGGFFVEFGATDGVLFSNSLMLERDYGWSGICAEPNPGFFEKLKANRTCTVSPDLITATTGERVEFLLADEYGSAVRHVDADNNAERRRPFLEAGSVVQLTGISLHDFLKKHGAPKTIDYLSIDTEGSEYEILAAFPFAEWDLRLISVEHNFTPDRERIRALLEGHGYVRAAEMQWDDCYARTAPETDAETAAETAAETDAATAAATGETT